jgi:hypothetical protein
MMMSARLGKGLVGGSVVVAALACAGSALAGAPGSGSGSGAGDKGYKSNGSPSSPAPTSSGGNQTIGASATDKAAGREGATGEGNDGSEDKSLSIGIDFVVGSATTDAVTQNVPANLQPTGNTTIDSSKVTTYSFLIGGSIELCKHFELGLRVPFQAGTIDAPTYSRSASALGNIELEPEVGIPLNEGLELKLALGIALPTAQGTPIPATAADVPSLGIGIDQSGYDRATVQKATAMTRGYEENALYEPDHLGLVPKITLSWFQREKWHVDPWVKLENLIATSSDEKFIGELVLGANAGYSVTKVFEPALRVWGNIPVTGADFKAVGVVEPQLRFHAGDGVVLAGVILPFAGPLTSPYAVGVRLAGGIRF